MAFLGASNGSFWLGLSGLVLIGVGAGLLVLVDAPRRAARRVRALGRGGLRHGGAASSRSRPSSAARGGKTPAAPAMPSVPGLLGHPAMPSMLGQPPGPDRHVAPLPPSTSVGNGSGHHPPAAPAAVAAQRAPGWATGGATDELLVVPVQPGSDYSIPSRGRLRTFVGWLMGR